MCKMARFPFFFLIVFLHNSLFEWGVKGTLQERFKDDIFHIFKNRAMLIRDDINRDPVTADKVNYYLFTRKNPEEFIRLDTNHLDMVANRTKIVFLIHGWTNSREVPWYKDTTNAFLQIDDYAVVQVDWKEPANQVYSVSSINTYEVAKYIAGVVIDLHTNYNVPLNNILLVGHSLGGQITGFVGKRFYKTTLQKLPRIIALDPAGPFFKNRPIKERLNKDDAEIVVVLHTNGGTYGFLDSCGTIDFFANNGKSQPGCKRINLVDVKSVAEPFYCDHMRAPTYFAEAILNPDTFIAKKCSNWATYKVKYCDKEEVALGDLSTVATGSFYFETNDEKPFGRKSSSLLPSLPIKIF